MNEQMKLNGVDIILWQKIIRYKNKEKTPNNWKLKDAKAVKKLKEHKYIYLHIIYYIH